MLSILKLKDNAIKTGIKVLPLVVLGVIINDLIRQDKIGMSFNLLAVQQWDAARFLLLVPIFGLMFLNWSFEAFKWKILTKSYYKMSFKAAFRAIWSGVSTALTTPNRLGDFIGKIMHLPDRERKKGLVSSFYGSYSQWLITIGMGWMGWLFFGNQMIENNTVKTGISVAGFIGIIFFVVIFLQSRPLRIVPKKWRKYFKESPGFDTKIRIVIFSFLRYLAFATQFYLLIRFMGIELGYVTVFLKITLFYLITSFVPVTFWGEIGIKESVAVWVFSGLIYNSLIIIAVTLLLWLINLVIPAFVGNYYLIKSASAKGK